MDAGMFYWLATEAEVEGFGFSFDLLDSNIINLTITIAVLVYFVGGLLKNILSERSSAIEQEIREAEQRQQQAAEKLADEQQKLAQAQQEAQDILAAAQEGAKAAKAEILERATQEIARIQETASQDTTTSQERVITQLRQQVAAMALARVEADIQTRLSGDESAQHKLIDRSIALLGEK